MIAWIRLVIVCKCLYIVTMLKAQDVHSSINESNLQQLHPASTGLFNGTHRFGLQYRSQWYQVPVSYKTVGCALDTKIIPWLGKNDRVGMGLSIQQDKAGDIGYSTSSVLFSGAYHYPFFTDTSASISFGLSTGIHQSRFNTSAMTFDAQFDGLVFNPALSSGEQFNTVQGSYWDLNTGFVFRKRFLTHQIVAAFGASHVNKPHVIFDNAILARRYVITIQDQIRHSTHLTWYPALWIQMQGSNREWVPAVTAIIHSQHQTAHYTGIQLAYRTRDALVLGFRYGTEKLLTAFSYDITLSNFKIASRYQGAFELQLVYCIPQQKFRIPNSVPCSAGF
ncbi:MAG: PorP/SprF family type IX secretion system membrane protein [Bacteroidia bacterium]